MKYFKTYTEHLKEGFADYSMSHDIKSFNQSTPNGMYGTYDKEKETRLLTDPLDNEYKTFARDFAGKKKIKKKKYTKKVRDLRVIKKTPTKKVTTMR